MYHPPLPLKEERGWYNEGPPESETDLFIQTLPGRLTATSAKVGPAAGPIARQKTPSFPGTILKKSFKNFSKTLYKKTC